ncbi:MAG: hypothetical protein H0T78_11190 [Longispora sp.]|nr:hypothetical protein [Longispora sp. (in: high G+C Gram-positive bacteria)]
MKPHRFDTVSLIFGLLFVGLSTWWGVAQIVSLSATSVGWVAAVALLGLGVIGIVTSARSQRSQAVESAGSAESAGSTAGFTESHAPFTQSPPEE